MSTAILDKRRRQVATVTDGKAEIACAKPSLAGSVSQRACVFCGSRVVLLQHRLGTKSFGNGQQRNTGGIPARRCTGVRNAPATG